PSLVEKPLAISPHWASARDSPRVAPLPAQIVGCAQEDIPLPNTHSPLRNLGSPCAAASLPGDLDVPRCFAPRDLSLAVNWPRLCGSPVADRKSTRLNSSHRTISYAVFCLKKKKINTVHS